MNTRQLPIRTKDLVDNEKYLRTYLPSIYSCTCYNDYDQPFAQELKDTELGHLFEHILLEYLCLLKLQNKYKNATFSGRTSWNWHKDPRGVYHIRIRKSKQDNKLIFEAMEKSIKLFNLVTHTSR